MTDKLPNQALHPTCRSGVSRDAMQFTIASDHPSLPGHFPGRPIVPGVLLVERVIEAIERQHGALGALRLPQVKFIQPLLPGEVATIVLEGETQRWRFRVLRGDMVLASGEVVATLAPSLEPGPMPTDEQA